MNGAFAILAMDEAGGIGKNGVLPWPRIPGELSWFREMTMGKTVLVGRKTFETLPPLKGRRVVVLSRQDMGEQESTSDLQGFLKGTPDVAIIGGAEVYKLAFPIVHTWYVTRVSGTYECDAFFPHEWFSGPITPKRGMFLWGRNIRGGDGPPKWSVDKLERLKWPDFWERETD